MFLLSFVPDAIQVDQPVPSPADGGDAGGTAFAFRQSSPWLAVGLPIR